MANNEFEQPPLGRSDSASRLGTGEQRSKKNQKTNMSDEVIRLSSEIRTLARGKIGAATLDVTVDEVIAHLDASIQARLEMGDNIEEAERAALQEFGSAKAFIDALLKSQKPARVSSDETFGLTFATLLGGTILSVLFASWYTNLPVMLAVYLLIATPLIASAIVAWRSARLHPFTSFAALLAAIPMCTLIAATFLIGNGLQGYVPRYELRAEAERFDMVQFGVNEMRADLAEEDAAALRKINSTAPPYEISLQDATLEEAENSSGSIIFASKPPPYNMQVVATRAAALKLIELNRKDREETWSLDLRGALMEADAAKAQMSAPLWLNYVRCVAPASEDAGSLWLVVVAVQGLSAGASWLARRARLDHRSALQ